MLYSVEYRRVLTIWTGYTLKSMGRNTVVRALAIFDNMTIKAKKRLVSDSIVLSYLCTKLKVFVD